MKNLIRLPEVQKMTGLSRTVIYERISNGTFPKPVKLGSRAVAWVDEEVQEFIDSLIANREASHQRREVVG